MKCFVTGSAGYIGSSIVKRLTNMNHDVIGLFHQSYPKESMKNATYIQGDITDKESFSSAIDDVDIVFHCAAKVQDYGSKKLFYDVNVKGTQQLVEAFKETNIDQFIYLSHLPYESSASKSFYSQTKQIAESFLLKTYNETGFPVTIIRPGNVYGPGNSIWVCRPLEAIRKNRLLLVNNGMGIFLHTYIENLLDAIALCMKNPDTIGKIITVTDGDNTTTWNIYFNDLAAILGKRPITKNLSKRSAILLGYVMKTLLPPLGIPPIITPFAVEILTNTKTYDLQETQQIIDYKPKITYREAMKQIETWIKTEQPNLNRHLKKSKKGND